MARLFNDSVEDKRKNRNEHQRVSQAIGEAKDDINVQSKDKLEEIFKDKGKNSSIPSDKQNQALQSPASIVDSINNINILTNSKQSGQELNSSPVISHINQPLVSQQLGEISSDFTNKIFGKEIQESIKGSFVEEVVLEDIEVRNADIAKKEEEDEVEELSSLNNISEVREIHNFSENNNAHLIDSDNVAETDNDSDNVAEADNNDTDDTEQSVAIEREESSYTETLNSTMPEVSQIEESNSRETESMPVNNQEANLPPVENVSASYTPIASSVSTTPVEAIVSPSISTPPPSAGGPPPPSTAGGPPPPPPPPSTAGGPPPPPPPPSTAGGPPPPPGSPNIVTKASTAPSKSFRSKELEALEGKLELSKDLIKNLYKKIEESYNTLNNISSSVVAKGNVANYIIKISKHAEQELSKMEELYKDKITDKPLDTIPQDKIKSKNVETILQSAQQNKQDIDQFINNVTLQIEKAKNDYELVLSAKNILKIKDSIEKISNENEESYKALEKFSDSRAEIFHSLNTGDKYNNTTLTPSLARTLLNKAKKEVQANSESISNNKFDSLKKLQEIDVVAKKYAGNQKIQEILAKSKVLNDKVEKNFQDVKDLLQETELKSFLQLERKLTQENQQKQPIKILGGPPPPPMPGGPPPPPMPGAKTLPSTSLSDARKKELGNEIEIKNLINKYTTQLSVLKTNLVKPNNDLVKSVNYTFKDSSLESLKKIDPNIFKKVFADQELIGKLSKAMKPLKDLVTSANSEVLLEGHKLEFLKYDNSPKEQIELSQMRISILNEFLSEANKNGVNEVGLNAAETTFNLASSILGKFLQGLSFANTNSNKIIKSTKDDVEKLVTSISDIIKRLNADHTLLKELAHSKQELDKNFSLINSLVRDKKEQIQSLIVDKAAAILKPKKDSTPEAEEIKFNEKIEVAHYELYQYKNLLDELTTTTEASLKLTDPNAQKIFAEAKSYLINKQIDEIKVKVEESVTQNMTRFSKLEALKLEFDKSFLRHHNTEKKNMSAENIAHYTKNHQVVNTLINSTSDKLKENRDSLEKLKKDYMDNALDKVAAQNKVDDIISKFNEAINKGNEGISVFSKVYLDGQLKVLKDATTASKTSAPVTKKFVKSTSSADAVDVKTALAQSPKALAAKKEKEEEQVNDAIIAAKKALSIEEQIAFDIGLELHLYDHSNFNNIHNLDQIELLGGILIEV